MAEGYSGEMPASGTVEDILSLVASVDPSAVSFTLWVPGQLSMGGSPLLPDMAMAVVLDRLLGAGFMPAGFEEGRSGRLYRYEREGAG
jgi:hypothetical protein